MRYPDHDNTGVLFPTRMARVLAEALPSGAVPLKDVIRQPVDLQQARVVTKEYRHAYQREALAVAHLAKLEVLAGLALHGAVSPQMKARATAIEEWATTLRRWNQVDEPLPAGTKRFDPERGFHRIHPDNVEDLNFFLTSGDYPRHLGLAAGVVNPSRHRTKKDEEEGTEPIVDWRVAVAGEVCRTTGASAEWAWGQVLGWDVARLQRRAWPTPDDYDTGVTILSHARGTGGAPVGVVRSQVTHPMLGALVGDGGRYSLDPRDPLVYIAPIGALRRDGDDETITHAHYVAFSRYPGDVVSGEGGSPGAEPFDLAYDLRGLLRSWQRDTTAPLYVVEVASRYGHDIDFVAEVGVGGERRPIHITIHVAPTPAAWGAISFWETVPFQKLVSWVRNAWARGLAWTPWGLVDLNSPSGAVRVGVTSNDDVAPPSKGTFPEEQLLVDLLDLPPL